MGGKGRIRRDEIWAWLVVQQAKGLLDVPGDWLVRLGLVVTVRPQSWLGYIERSHGAVMAVWALSLGPVISL